MRRASLGPWLAGCAKHVVAPAAPVVVQQTANVSGADSLKAHAAARGVMYGCAVNDGLLGKDEAYTELVRQQASIVVAENSMKWAPMRPSPTETVVM